MTRAPKPKLVLAVLAVFGSCAVPQENQCSEEQAEPSRVPAFPMDAVVATVLNDLNIHTRAAAAACTPQTGNAVVAYLGGDDDMQACKLQGLWGKVLRLAGAHAAAFAAGRILVLAAPDPWVGGCEGGEAWTCYFEPPVSRNTCSLSTLGLTTALADSPERVWSDSGWAPWSREISNVGTPSPKPVLWSACGNQMRKYGGAAPHDHHSNDFWPMAPRPPLSRAHADVPTTAWQAAFLHDLTKRPTARTRTFVDRIVAGLGWQSPWSSGFAIEGYQYSSTIGLQIRRGDKYQGGQDQLSDVKAFHQVYLPAVQRLHAQHFGNATTMTEDESEPATVFLATDSRLIVKHVMEENGGVVGGLRFATAGFASPKTGGQRPSTNQSPQVPRDVWMRGEKGWGSGEFISRLH